MRGLLFLFCLNCFYFKVSCVFYKLCIEVDFFKFFLVLGVVYMDLMRNVIFVYVLFKIVLFYFNMYV